MLIVLIGLLAGAAGWLLGRADPRDRLARLVGPPGGGPADPRALVRRPFRRGAPRPRPDPPADVVSQLAALLRAGTTADVAVARLAGIHRDVPAGLVLAEVARASQLGGDVPSAFRRAAEGLGEDDARVYDGLGVAWQIANRCGAPLAEMLERFAAAVRADDDARDARQAALAGPRSTVTVLTWLPAGGLLVGTLIGADPLRVLFTTGPGLVCLAVGASLLLLGRFWMSSFLRSRESRRVRPRRPPAVPRLVPTGGPRTGTAGP